MQRPLPDNTQHSQQADFHVPGGIRTGNPKKQAAAELHLRPRGHWDGLLNLTLQAIRRKRERDNTRQERYQVLVMLIYASKHSKEEKLRNLYFSARASHLYLIWSQK